MPISLSLEDKRTADRAIGIKEELKQSWNARDEMMAKDRQLLMMQYKKRVIPFELVLSNDIAVQHAFSIAILGGKPPIFRLPITLQDQEERDKMNRSERFITGVWREADKNHRSAGHNPLLYDILFFATLGSVALFPLIVRQPKKPPQFFIYVYDPINCYPDYGEQGLLRFARSHVATPKDAVTQAIAQGWDVSKINTEGKGVEIDNIWEREDDEDGTRIYNTVVVGGAPVKPRTLHTQFDHIPIIMQPMNGVPMQPYMSPFTNQQDTVGNRAGTADWGRPVYHMNRDIVPAFDRNLTYMAEISRNHALPKYKYVSEGGIQTMSVKDWNEAMVINLAQGEDIAPLVPATSPREREGILQMLENKIQQGSLSRLAMGMLDLEISGVTLERATSQARAILEPYLTGVQNALADCETSLMGQLKRSKGNAKIKIATRQAQLGPEMGYLVEDFGKEDIPDTSYLEVTLPMNLPDNRMFKLTMARTAKPGNDPLLPDRTIREQLLDVQDEALMERLLDEDSTKRSPAILAIRQMAGMRRMIEEWKLDPERFPEEIEEAEAALEIMRQEFRQIIAPRQQPATDLEARRREPSPSEQPPEESAVPPGLADLTLNRTSAIPQQNNGRARIAAIMRGDA